MNKRSTDSRASTSIPYEIKVHLDSLERYGDTYEGMREQAKLTEWVKGVTKKGTELNVPIGVISKCIDEWATEKGYTKRQIRRAKLGE